jgi:hypothetical protein
MKKTVREWYNDLEDVPKILAIANTSKELQEKQVDNLSSALIIGFRWDNKPESILKKDYWKDIVARLEQEEGSGFRKWLDDSKFR